MTNKSLPRDVFLYLLSVVALGMVSVNFGNLLFQFINVYVPDIVADRFMNLDAYYGSIRWAIATLLIVFPVFVWVTQFLAKDLKANPEKRELKIRKWLLYLTLFVAAVVIIGDLIALVFNFLQGELTLRFSLKILTILSIAGSIFYYYLNELREQGARPMRIFSGAVIVFVSAAVVGGFFVAGLPQSQRLRNIDDQRVQDLQVIQGQIIQFWQSKSALPNDLNALRDSISGFVPPTDPQTAQPYEYAVLGRLQFRLCAVFQTESQSNSIYTAPKSVAPYPATSIDEANNVWAHGIGRVCFERTIDPDLYPVRSKQP